MGISSSKNNASGASSSSSPSANVRRNRSIRSRLLKSSCLRLRRSEHDGTWLSDCSIEENGKMISCPAETKEGSLQELAECYTVDKAERTDHTNCTNSDKEFKAWGESSFTSSVSGERNTSRSLSSRSLNPPNHLHSSSSFYPGNLSFRLTRANSLGSSNVSPTSPNVTISNDEEDRIVPSVSAVHRNLKPQCCDFFPTCFPDRPSRMCDIHCASNSFLNCPPTPEYSDNLPDNHGVNSRHDLVIDKENERTDCTRSLTNNMNPDDGGIRFANIFPQEQIECNTRLSRTLSVGRLRDRLLPRTPTRDSDLYNFQVERGVRCPRQVTRRQYLDNAPGEATPGASSFSRLVHSDNGLSSMPISYYGSPNHEFGASRPRETRYRDLMEQRSNFSERRRRIRSQVHALQQIGRRSGNLSDHERSCIISGQYLAGHCSCHIAAREITSNDDATARASISRIATLAEALFEVLDEIHQQSAMLSSRHSASSVASIPAPNEVVDSLPIKIFSKFRKKPNEEAAQCYICLVEYEEGDSMRILPCHHEFHQACVDKWLREIHGVCPLCRGDACTTDLVKGGS